MAGKPKSNVGIFGVRAQVWGAITLVIFGVAAFLSREAEEPETGSRSPAHPDQKHATSTNSHAPLPPPSRAASRLLNAGELASTESGAFAGTSRENEPVSVLMNELFSPDPDVRMAAATILSRRSVYASEAIPVLRRASRDELDEQVRKRMKEAIMNIRGYVAPPNNF
jgi:hypothetical protein